MKIYLSERAEILNWANCFRILAMKLFIPIWNIVGIPEEFLKTPEPILRIAQEFCANCQRGVYTRQGLKSQGKVLNHYEALRMIGLGDLYHAFGQITGYYDQATAMKLYDWGIRHYGVEEHSVWLEWDSVFKHLVKEPNSLKSIFSDEICLRILRIVMNEFGAVSANSQKLKIEMININQRLYKNDEEMESFLNLSISKEVDSENIDDLLCLELLVFQEHSYLIWSFINNEFTTNVKEALFDFGNNILLKKFALGLNNNLMSYVFKAGQTNGAVDQAEN